RVLEAGDQGLRRRRHPGGAGARGRDVGRANCGRVIALDGCGCPPPDGAQDCVHVGNEQGKPGETPGVSVLVASFSDCRQIESSVQSMPEAGMLTTSSCPSVRGAATAGPPALESVSRFPRRSPWKPRNCTAAA